MQASLRIFLIAVIAVCISTVTAYSQAGCLSINATATDNVSCFAGNDGEITLNIVSTTGLATAPWNIELYFRDSGGGLTQLAFHNGVTATSMVFRTGNGSLNQSGADAFGIPANSIDPGSEYRIVVTASGTGSFTCRTKQINGIEIIEPPELIGTVASTTPACTPGTGTISLDVSGGATPYSFAWTGPTSIGNVEDPTGLNAGTYSVTISDGNGCTENITGIVVPPPPNATITAAGPFCETAPATTLSAATPGGTWSGPGITNPATGAFNPATAGPGNHIITYSIGGACPSSDTETIVVQAAPNVTITPVGPFCQTATAVNLVAATTGGTWSGPGVTAAGLFTPSTAGPGSHVITYTLTVGVCTAVDTETIVVETPPNATITAAGPFCETALAVNLVAATTGGTWSGAGITNPATGAFNPATAGVGSHVITYTLTVGACTVVDTETIVVQAAPNATITAAGPFCATGPIVTLTAATTGGTWSGTGITNSITGAFNPALATIGNNTITYSVTVGACTSTDTETIVVQAAPNATITAAGPFCATDAATTLAAATPGGTWSGTGITNPATGAFNPALATIGNNTITYSITIGACTSTDTETIVVQSPPNATITAAGPFCATAPVTNLVAATTGGVWSGLGITNPATGEFNPATAGAGSHTITYTITVGACTAVDTETIVVDSAPNVTINPVAPICLPAPAITLTAATAGGTWSGSGITNSATGEFTPASASIGNNVITYTLTLGACTVTDTETIVVNATPNATITAAGPFCETSPAVVLLAASPGGTWSGLGITNPATGAFNPALAGPGSHIITYSIGGVCPTSDTETIVVDTAPNATITAVGPFCSTDTNLTLTAATLGGTWSGSGIINGTTGEFSPAAATVGNNIITYTLTIGACTVVDTETIVVQSPPNATITAVGPFCETAALTNLIAATPGGVWSGQGITNPATGEFNPAVAGPGSHTIAYDVTVGSCSANDTQIIVVNASPSAVLSGLASICEGDDATLTVTFTGGGPTWNFSYSDGTSTFNRSASASPFTFIVNPTATTTYTLLSVADANCTGTASGTATVTINTPVLTLPATTICENGGVVDLTTIVSAAPAGGTFTFTGTNVTGNNFDPTGLAGVIQIQVGYTEACAAPTGILELTVTTAAAMVVPTTAVQVCEGAGLIDLNAYVSGTPGDYVFSGDPAVNTTTDQFNPAGLSGSHTILVDYVGSCVAPQVSFTIDVIAAPTLNVFSTATCANAAAIDLRSRVTASAAGGVYTFSGHPNITGGFMFNPSGLVGPTTVNVNVSYAIPGCAVVNNTIPISIFDPADAACSGGDCATVIVSTATTADPCLNPAPEGTVTFNIDPATPAVNVVGVRITINGPVSDTHTNDPLFTDLFAGMYTYEVIYGDPSNPACIKTGVFQIPSSGSVGTPAATVQTQPFCANGTGSVLITVPERPAGDNLEWSPDGVTWTVFQNGGIVTGVPVGLAPTFERIINVRRTAADDCYAAVTVVMQSTNPAIVFDASNYTTTQTTCNNNDGALNVTNLPTGGGGGPYSYRLDGTFFNVLPTGNSFTGLASGNHNLVIIDNLGCEHPVSFTITFPGYINTTLPTTTNADCASNGTNGQISFTILDPGTYQYAITTDPTFEPGASDYLATGGLNPVIPNLTGGQYYIWLKSTASLCPTRLPSVSVGGVVAVSFDLTSANEVCFGTGGTLTLNNIVGAANVDYTYELTSALGTFTGSIPYVSSLSPVVLTNLAHSNYQVRLIQDQTAATGCVFTTAHQTFLISGPAAALGVQTVTSTVSFPEQPTGTMTVTVTGSGIPFLDGNNQPYYEVWVVNATASYISEVIQARRNPIDFQAVFAGLAAGDYQIFIRDAGACELVATTHSIGVDTEIFVPNVFTPNGDDKNETFYVRNLPASGNSLTITNRWGKEVYTSKNYTPETLWNGGSAPDGVYFYRLQISGGKTFTGWVEIIRGSKP